MCSRHIGKGEKIRGYVSEKDAPKMYEPYTLRRANKAAATA